MSSVAKTTGYATYGKISITVALWKVGNYAKSGGRRKFAFSLRGSRVNAGEVLRASGSYARYGFILIASQKGLPSDDG